MPLLPLDSLVAEFAPDIDLKPSLSLSLFGAPLPCCASTSQMLFCSNALLVVAVVCVMAGVANEMGYYGVVGGTRLKCSSATLRSFSAMVF